MLTADQTFSLGTQVAAPLDRRQRNFWIAFACALVLHGALILELNRSSHEATLGDESGSADAISVELVTEADLAKRSSDVAPASPPPGQPTPTPPAPTPPAPTPPVETPTPPTPAEPAQPPQPETPQPSETKVQPQEPTSPSPETPTPAPEQKSLVPDLATEFPDLPSLQEPKQTPKAEAMPEKAEPAKKAEPPAKPKRPAPDQLALSPPPPPRTSPGGAPSRSSSFSRPPGITRSGQNDDFARGVIRALRQTMPPPRGIFGRVTVRLFLNDNGDLAEVRVVESSGISNLDQSIVFATKQTNFPLPPYGATVADRTFMISYVYN